MTRSRTIGILAGAAAAALALTSCAASGWTVTAAEASGQDGGELAAYGGNPCPDALPPSSDAHRLGSQEAASDAPPAVSFDRAWLCEYSALGEPAAGGGSTFEWTRQGSAREFSDEGRAELAAALAGISLHDGAEYVCTADLGPQYLVVLSRDGDLTGIAIEDYGCRAVRLTDDPFAVAPGESDALPSGWLVGGSDLLGQVRQAASR